MCRFLLVKFQTPTQPTVLLQKFAEMSQKSKALDGDWQGDGWGISWIDDQNNWEVKKSLAPIWKDSSTFHVFPETLLFMAHARSASFPQHKGVIEFNQPYISGKYAFVFNGLLEGVSVPNVPGKIGAEKIWYLLQKELENCEPEEALENIKQLLINNSRKVNALNIGLASNTDIYSLNYFTKSLEYYTLHKWETDGAEIICSELI